MAAAHGISDEITTRRARAPRLRRHQRLHPRA